MNASPAILVAPYAFKGTLTASEAASVIVHELRRLKPSWQARSLPLADGGRGTMAALAAARGGHWRRVESRDALNDQKEARWVELSNGWAAFEVAELIALDSVRANQRDPGALTTRGVGIVLREIAATGIRDVIVGLGDSATHDCGVGIAADLGYRFYDSRGVAVPAVGHSLGRITGVDASSVPPEIRSLNIVAFCDVLNPLLGDDGAARCFAPQKGADALQVQALEEGTRGFAGAVARELGRLIEDEPGAGAAGGMGAGLAGMLDAQLVGGADAVLDATSFDALASMADVVLTGEGRLDRQSLLGKGIGRVAARARSADKPCIIFAGAAQGDVAEFEQQLGSRVVDLGGTDIGVMTPGEASERLAAGVARWVQSTVLRSA